jgi:2-polyprenyl-3-methyl-5-hydroxy-6-metoxy-1,4-benzoquinol methylase
MEHLCKICGAASDTKTYWIEESKLRTGEKFEYFKCPKCGCFQITEIPENLDSYYRSYGPLKKNNINNGKIATFFRKRLFANITRNHFNLTKYIINYLSEISKAEWIPAEWILPKLAKYNSKILDLGCGSGELIKKMAQSGFSNIIGADPNIEKDSTYHYGKIALSLYKKSVEQLNGKFDLIMLHHVLEHLPNQAETIQSLAKLMNKDSTLVIALPIIESEIWETYKLDSFQLRDVPRHLFLHSKDSLKFLFESNGLKITAIRFSAAPFVLMESERIKRKECYNPNFKFTKQEIKAYQRKAKQLQKKGQSGIAYYYLQLS